MQIQIENNTVNGDGPERINMNVNIINSQNIQNIQNENIINSQNIQNIQNENIITMNPLKINIITECTQTIREILSIESNPPIDDIIDSGITPKLIEFLNINYNKYSNLQFDACWSLTNLCSINNKHNPNAIPYLIQLLAFENISIKEQSIWALGNICGKSTECRKLVLSNNILLQLIPLIQSICNEITTNNSSISKEKLTLLRYVLL